MTTRLGRQHKNVWQCLGNHRYLLNKQGPVAEEGGRQVDGEIKGLGEDEDVGAVLRLASFWVETEKTEGQPPFTGFNLIRIND
ncbi:hypothetical protein RUM44_000662 [Polyplax serrata]|uniref:Uncharacterized protein n=1 Tax=Polyplax serrata TaxID=468196 RepID=A0ABR1B6Z1_POLSC